MSRLSTEEQRASVRSASDSLFRALDPPLIVVCAVADGRPAGCIVGFHAQCSLEPVRYAVWLSTLNHTYQIALRSDHLAIHVLDRSDHTLAELFGGRSGDDVDKFVDVAWSPGPGGVPMIDACPNVLVIRKTGMWSDGGDHVCFVGEPTMAAGWRGKSVPMRLSDAGDITAGHQQNGTNTFASAEHSDGEGARRELEDAAAGAGHPIDLNAS